MEFSSLAEMVAHINSKSSQASAKVAEEVKKKAKIIITDQVSGISGQMQNTPTVNWSSAIGFEVEIADNGSISHPSWVSLVGKTKGEKFFPMHGLESGSTWGRDATTIMDTWESWGVSNIPKKYLSSMQGLGVPIS